MSYRTLQGLAQHTFPLCHCRLPLWVRAKLAFWKSPNSLTLCHLRTSCSCSLSLECPLSQPSPLLVNTSEFISNTFLRVFPVFQVRSGTLLLIYLAPQYSYSLCPFPLINYCSFIFQVLGSITPWASWGSDDDCLLQAMSPAPSREPGTG